MEGKGLYGLMNKDIYSRNNHCAWTPRYALDN